MIIRFVPDFGLVINTAVLNSQFSLFISRNDATNAKEPLRGGIQ
jgi:hypothetical protein